MKILAGNERWVIAEEVTCNEAGMCVPVFGRKIMEEKTAVS